MQYYSTYFFFIRFHVYVCVCVVCVCVCVCAYRSGAEARASRFAFHDIYMLFLFNQSRFTISGIFFRAPNNTRERDIRIIPTAAAAVLFRIL